MYYFFAQVRTQEILAKRGVDIIVGDRAALRLRDLVHRWDSVSRKSMVGGGKWMRWLGGTGACEKYGQVVTQNL